MRENLLAPVSRQPLAAVYAYGCLPLPWFLVALNMNDHETNVPGKQASLSVCGSDLPKFHFVFTNC
jgi:hypothetical protein